MIVIVDYGAGNLRSVFNAFRYIGADVRIAEKGTDIKGASKIVLPGVGSSRDTKTGLEERGFVQPLSGSLRRGVPFLGICMGLQILFDTSDESGGCDCLGIVKGDVRLFPKRSGKVPQIGWNTVKYTAPGCPMFKGIPDESYFYFVHSYYCDVKEPGVTAGETEYGLKYLSALWKDNIFAVQFHPERSQANGLRILENFIKL